MSCNCGAWPPGKAVRCSRTKVAVSSRVLRRESNSVHMRSHIAAVTGFAWGSGSASRLRSIDSAFDAAPYLIATPKTCAGVAWPPPARRRSAIRGKRVRSCRRGCRAAVLRPPPLHAQRRSAESRVIDRATARKPGRQGLCRGGARCWQMHTSGEGNGAPVLRHRRPLRCSGGRSQGFRTPTSCRTNRPADRCQLHGA